MNTARAIERQEIPNDADSVLSFQASQELELSRIGEQTLKDLSPRSFQDVANMIEAIGQLEKQLRLYDTQSEEAQQFFRKKTSTVETRIEQLKFFISSFLQQKGLKNIQTPYGTAYFRKNVVKQWGDSDSLVQWAQQHVPHAVRVKQEADKRMLAEHIRKTGEAPDHYNESTEEQLYIKY